MAKQEKARAAPSAAPADELEVIDLLSDSDDEASPAAAPAIMPAVPAVAPLDSRESDAGAAALLLTYLCWAVSYIRDAELVPRKVC